MTITWFSLWKTRNFLRGWGGESGLTLIELLVALGIISILVAVAVPSINSSQMNLTMATEEVSGDLRIARASATGRGRHYRITFHSDSYSVERLEAIVDGDGNKTWVPDGSPRTVQFPNTVSVTDGVGSSVEFNSRGLVEPPSVGTPADLVSITLSDSRTHASKTIEIWPSGQIQGA